MIMAQNGPAVTAAPAIPPVTAQPKAIPPLQNGDHLSAEEYWRRYCAMPNVNKAELIEGVVYMPSPVRQEDHGGPHTDVVFWLCLYRRATPGVDTGDNPSVRLDERNNPQPDTCLFILPSFVGNVRMDAGYIIGGPELIAEVTATSAAIDLHDKLIVYCRSRVREYIVYRVFDQAIDWFILRGEKYEHLAPDASGIFRSEVFPGLWLDSSALLARDLDRLTSTLQQGIATTEHAAFVTRLQQQAAALKK
jgi:hypothetical protein